MNQGSPVLLTTERHMRPLAKLEPEEQRAAWQQVVESAPNGKITAQHVQRVVDTLKPRAVPAHDLFPGPALQPDIERIATYHLLEAALLLITTELGPHRPTMTVSAAQAHEAARLLLELSLFKGAGSMLAASARAES